MKKEIVRLLALLVFGAAALSSCSIENRGHRGRYNNDRHHNDRHHDDDHDHHYRNY
jgi:ABC-type nickel/cobalt efflux system permease component RcnA